VREQLESAESIQQLANAAGTPEGVKRGLKRVLACIAPEGHHHVTAPESEWLVEESPDGAGGAEPHR
jgi:hypothetical protein